MSKQLIAAPYAQALFNYVRSQEDQTFLAQCQRLVAVVKCCHDFLADPRVISQEKLAVLCEAVDALPTAITQLLTVMAENDRLILWPEVMSGLEVLIKKADNILVVDVETAYPLSDELKARLVAFLSKKYQKTIEYREHLCPELIGGIRLCLGDQVMDCSLKYRLQHLHQQLVA